MRIKNATLYLLEIPFQLEFKHTTFTRNSSSSAVLRVESECGAIGYGEAAPRAYVSGEDLSSIVDDFTLHYWPALKDLVLPELGPPGSLQALGRLLVAPPSAGLVARTASRAMVELAALDCGLRSNGRSLGELLPPKVGAVRYGVAVSASSLSASERIAGLARGAQMPDIKVKVGDPDDLKRVEIVRRIVGPEVPLRIDANGAWTVEEAISRLPAFEAFNVAAVEQPLAAGPVEDLARVRKSSNIPIMVDESLVTLEDARALIEAEACDIFNVRVSKCGGLSRCLEFIELAREAGLSFQIGAHVGETAILSAAGRFLAAAAPDALFVEGSAGDFLLREDVSTGSVRFGLGGLAPLLTGPGLGITVEDERLAKYATRRLDFERGGS